MILKAATKPTDVNKGSPAAEAAFAIGPLIGRVRSIMLSKLDAELQPFGLTGMQFAILKNVADGTGATAADLCRLMHYDNGSMTRMVDRLEDVRGRSHLAGQSESFGIYTGSPLRLQYRLHPSGVRQTGEAAQRHIGGSGSHPAW